MPKPADMNGASLIRHREHAEAGRAAKVGALN
jgi:hypothetical protein